MNGKGSQCPGLRPRPFLEGTAAGERILLRLAREGPPWNTRIAATMRAAASFDADPSGR
jgi:hypothetical protein